MRVLEALLARNRRRYAFAVAVTFAMLALIACGGDDDDDDDSQPTLAATTSSGRPEVLSGVGPDEKASSSLKIGAASDLRNAMTQLQPDLEAACTTAITYVFGSSGQIRTQLLAGAEFGLFLSADIAYPRELAMVGKVVTNGTASYGVGRIVVATRSGFRPIEDLKDLGRSDVKRIAIANPEHAPYGRAAKEALESAGVYESIRGKLVLGENIRQTTDYVEKGDAEVGIVALALVIKGSSAGFKLIDAGLHKPIEQGGAVIKGTGAEKTARCVLQYILDEKGQAALKEFGFEPAP